MKKSKLKDWLLAGVLLLDEVAAAALVLVVLWFFGIRISWPIIVVLIVAVGFFIFLTQKYVVPSLHRRKISGREGMVGLCGRVVEPLSPSGLVCVQGEYWRARSVDGEVSHDEEVEVLSLNRLTLVVKRKVERA